MKEAIAPHGGVLVERIIQDPKARSELAGALAAAPRLALSGRQQSDFELIAVGGFSPVTGFMGEADYRSVISARRLSTGPIWTIPVVLAVSEADAARLAPGELVALCDERGRILGGMRLAEKYRRDPAAELPAVFRTEDPAHPGVAAALGEGPVLIAGPIDALELPAHDDFLDRRLTPRQTRAEIARRGWRRVVGFQTRNPIHRAHEYIVKTAMEIADGLLLHPLVGATKGDDVPAEVRMRCYQVLLEKYFPADRVLLAVNPAAMRYAGPAEAIFHAILRKNFGCTHFIVGRDHAGVGSYYGSYDAQKIFDEFSPAELGITPLFFDNSFFCKACDEMASSKTCPHPPEEWVTLSGTRVREMLRAGEAPPAEFSRPEVAEILIAAMRRPIERKAG